MTAYFFELLLLPIILLPIFCVFGLIKRKDLLIFELSFFTACVVQAFTDNSIISIALLIALILILNLFILLKNKINPKKQHLALFVEKSDGSIYCFDGDSIVNVPFLPQIELKYGDIINISKPFDI